MAIVVTSLFIVNALVAANHIKNGSKSEI